MNSTRSNKEELIKHFELKLEKSIDVEAEIYSFEHSIRVYLNKPQVVNNWLAGSIVIQDNLSENDIQQFISDFNFNRYSGFNILQIRDFLSKSSKIFDDIRYLVMMNTNLVLLYPLSIKKEDRKFPSPNFVHLIEYDSANKSLNLYVSEDKGDDEYYARHLRWLSNELLVKINNWSMSINPDPSFSCANLNTLKLYDGMINDYWKLYQSMKTTYWDRFSPIWKDLTNTDPEKFIYEDIHIACYLILAWKYLKTNVKCFVDLGCGNGLLVYILNDQGYNGYGIDMRERKIWSNQFYKDSNIKLIESTINPSEDVFDDCDWLIGNHSDELSPWLSVMAYKSKCNYFLIPCCMFDFYSKFDSKLADKSRSDSYLDYLEKIGHQFEFETIRDKLRIPSTKNACFLGLNKSENNVDLESISARIDAVMGKSSTSLEFKPRDLAKEQSRSTRNCTKNVPNDLKVFIVQTVVNKLVSNENSTNNRYIKKHDGTDWNCGRSISLNEVASLFDKDVLKKLKLECGGIKTLLRNHGRLFDVYDKENVRLKILNADMFKELDEEKMKVLKTKRCPFDQYHPDGCILKNEDCYFYHET